MLVGLSTLVWVGAGTVSFLVWGVPGVCVVVGSFLILSGIFGLLTVVAQLR